MTKSALTAIIFSLSFVFGTASLANEPEAIGKELNINKVVCYWNTNDTNPAFEMQRHTVDGKDYYSPSLDTSRGTLELEHIEAADMYITQVNDAKITFMTEPTPDATYFIFYRRLESGMFWWTWGYTGGDDLEGVRSKFERCELQ